MIMSSSYHDHYIKAPFLLSRDHDMDFNDEFESCQLNLLYLRKLWQLLNKTQKLDYSILQPQVQNEQGTHGTVFLIANLITTRIGLEINHLNLF